jgi:hypothetical protein
MLDFATTKVQAASDKLHAIESLCPDEPQVALAMIASSSNKSLDYLIRNTPTVPILPALIAFDDRILDTTLNIICPRETTDQLPTAKVELAKQILMLPVRNNGLNLFPTQFKAPCAYISSLVASGRDKHVKKFKSSLDSTVKDARDPFVHFTSMDVNKPSPVSRIITADHTQLLNTSNTNRLNQIYHSQYGIMSVLSSFLQQIMINNLRQSVVPDNDVDVSKLPRLQKSEILHLLTTTSKGRLASAITADLALPVNRIDAGATCAIMCYNLSLPVHSYGQFDADTGYIVQKCHKDDDAVFDTCGIHSNFCYYCHGQTTQCHPFSS